MKPTPLTLAAPLALFAATAQASPAVRDFELPPGPSPSPTGEAPQVQGPVDPDAPAATRPRPVDRPAVQPTTAPAPAPTAPVVVPLPTPSSAPTARTRPPVPDSPEPERTEPATEVAPATAPSTGDALPTAIPTAPPPVVTSTPASDPEAGSLGTVAGWVAGLVVLLGGLAAGLWWWRRRQPGAAKVPQIELPLVTPAAGPEPVTPPASLPLSTPAPLLRIDATPSHLTRSLMAATFTCRIALENRAEQPIDDVAVGLDLTTAHGSVPAGEQLADPARPLPEVFRVARLAQGERVEFARDIRLPTAEIRTLRQGEAQLYIPLLRVRAQAGAATPVARTFIVGTLPDAGATRLQPFRLDEIPQTYRMIGVAALD